MEVSTKIEWKKSAKGNTLNGFIGKRMLFKINLHSTKKWVLSCKHPLLISDYKRIETPKAAKALAVNVLKRFYESFNNEEKE